MPARIGGSEKERLIGLDLARAAAILIVVYSHSGGASLPLPDGVDLFFALSGFLIGTLLLEITERDPSIRSWLIFLVRRWMRTLPLYFLWVGVLFVILPPHGKEGLIALKYLTFTQNLAWPMEDWFPVSWSLTIEEWFYLLFSGVLLALVIRTKRWAVLLACGIFIAVPTFLRMHIGTLVDGNQGLGLRKIVMFRLDAIAYGVLIAWLYRYWRTTMHLLAYPLLRVGLVATLLVILTRICFSASWPYLGGGVMPLAFSLMMPWATQMQIDSAAASAAIHWLSTRSYCIYITHLSLIQIGNAWFGNILGTLIALIICAILAELSYRHFEMPLLNLRPPQFPKRTDVEALGVCPTGL